MTLRELLFIAGYVQSRRPGESVVEAQDRAVRDWKRSQEALWGLDEAIAELEGSETGEGLRMSEAEIREIEFQSPKKVKGGA